LGIDILAQIFPNILRQVEKYFNYFGIKLPSREEFNFLAGSGQGLRGAIRTVVNHGIQSVSNRENTCSQRNLLALQSARVARAVPPLVVTIRDVQRRADYPGLALVFADGAGRLPIWKQTLEGFDMWQSEVIREWKTAGRLEAQRNDLLLVLRERFQTEVPADLVQKIQQTLDLSVLTSWLSAALKVPSLDAFRSAMQPGSPPATQTN